MNFDQFKDTISLTGLARANRWTIEIHPPKGLTAIGVGILQQQVIGGNSGSFTAPTLGDFDPADLVNLNKNINFGPITGDIGINGAIEKLELYCKSVQMPSRDMENFEVELYAEKRSAAYRHTHDGFSTTFYCSEDLRERKYFENWQDLIFNPTTKKSNYYNVYVGSIVISKWNHSFEKKTAMYKFNEAYPTTVGAFELDTATPDILEIEITWNFRNYERIL